MASQMVGFDDLPTTSSESKYMVSSIGNEDVHKLWDYAMQIFDKRMTHPTTTLESFQNFIHIGIHIGIDTERFRTLMPFNMLLSNFFGGGGGLS